MPCEPKTSALRLFVPDVLSLSRFVFGRLREVGKAVTWKQHGKLFYSFALEDGLGESVSEVL